MRTGKKQAGGSMVAVTAFMIGTITVGASAGQVTVTIENLAPDGGTYLTPVWVGFHDGSFDTYDTGAAASMALERLAEDGNTGVLTDLFTVSGAGSTQATLIGDGAIPPLAPGDSATMTFELDGSSAQNRYFSYASMVIPSNDAFVANGDPLAHQIFAPDGSFLGADFFIVGSDVLDAGTEINDELPLNTAFFGQMSPDTGVDQNGIVAPHAGYLGLGSGGILDDPAFANADFLREGYPIAQIRITPEPASAAMLGLGVLAMFGRRATGRGRSRRTSC